MSIGNVLLIRKVIKSFFWTLWTQIRLILWRIYSFFQQMTSYTRSCCEKVLKLQKLVQNLKKKIQDINPRKNLQMSWKLDELIKWPLRLIKLAQYKKKSLEMISKSRCFFYFSLKNDPNYGCMDIFKTVIIVTPPQPNTRSRLHIPVLHTDLLV